MPTVITLFNHKGGVGRTTLARTLAIACTNRHLNTLLLDAERHDSNWLDNATYKAVDSHWIRSRYERGIRPMVDRLADSDLTCINGFYTKDIIIIDSSAHDTDRLAEYADISDTILIPLNGTSRAEARIAMKIADSFITDHHMSIHQILFVLNNVRDDGNATKGTTRTAPVTALLDTHDYKTISYIPHHPATEETDYDGKTLLELDSDTHITVHIAAKMDEILHRITWNRTPNPMTEKTIMELENGYGIRFTSVESLMADLES